MLSYDLTGVSVVFVSSADRTRGRRATQRQPSPTLPAHSSQAGPTLLLANNTAYFRVDKLKERPFIARGEGTGGRGCWTTETTPPPRLVCCAVWVVSVRVM